MAIFGQKGKILHAMFLQISGQHQFSFQSVPVLISNEYKPPFSPNEEARIAVSENFIQIFVRI